MVFGVGSFAHAVMTILKESGAEVCCYLTRGYGHHGPSLAGKVFDSEEFPSPIPLIESFKPDLIVPMSIAWTEQPWAKEISKKPILSPVGSAMQIEISRSMAANLCNRFDVPVPEFFHAESKEEAIEIINDNPRPYVLKNPICSPFSPVHTIVCETVEDTLGWIERIDDSEGIFLQEYFGTAEAGHFVFISEGKIQSLVTNQEYKRSFTGNMGPVAGAPLGGIGQVDPEDQYDLAKELIHPLQSWFLESGFTGPLQVTGIKKNGKWHAIEYNIRLGVTTTALLLRMLEDPLENLIDVVENRKTDLKWKKGFNFGCTLTVAGQGYPYVVPSIPGLPVDLNEPLDCDLWWNEVDVENKKLCMTSHQTLEMGHRVCDVNAFSDNLSDAIDQVYQNIKKIRCLGSYYRLDLGKTLWPPGTGF